MKGFISLEEWQTPRYGHDYPPGVISIKKSQIISLVIRTDHVQIQLGGGFSFAVTLESVLEAGLI